MPGVVQQTSGSTNEASLTLTFNTPLTVGNCIAIALCGYMDGSVSSVTLSGGISTFTRQITSGNNCEIWAGQNITESSLTLTITTTTPNIIAYAWEVAIPASVPQQQLILSTSATGYGMGGTAWTSSVAELRQKDVQLFAVGIGSVSNPGNGLAGPTTDAWSNATPLTVSNQVSAIAGYEVTVSSSYEYAGTMGTAGTWSSCIAAFQVANPGVKMRRSALPAKQFHKRQGHRPFLSSEASATIAIPGGSGGGVTGTSGTYGVVQECSGSTTGTSLTFSFPAATRSGNSIVIACAGYYGGNLSDITFAGSKSNPFTRVSDAGSSVNAEVWVYRATWAGSPGSGQSIVITASTAGIIAYAYEVGYSSTATDPPAVTITSDRSSGSTGTSGTSLTSSSTSATVAVAQEMAFGIAAVVNNSGTLTGPSSPWTNAMPISGIVGADSYAVGAVAGYATFTSSTTVAYTATVSVSGGNWGSTVATFACAGKQPGWSAYVFNEHPSYTGVSASFTVPSLTGGGQSVSLWVGLGNVQQIGLYLTYDTSSPGNNSIFYWDTFLPSGQWEIWSMVHYPIEAGDSMSMAMTMPDTGHFNMIVTDTTQGWTFTEVYSVLNINASLPPGGWIWPLASAEVIMEDEDGAVPDFGSVDFTVTTTPAINLTSALPLISGGGTSAPAPDDNAISQYPGPITLNGNGSASFTNYWNGDD